MKDVYIYKRVSSDDGSQNLANQNFGIQNYIQANDLRVIETVNNECSGTISAEKRGLMSLLNRMPQNSMLIVSEQSRLSRDPKNRELLQINWYCQDRKITIYSIKEDSVIGYKLEGYNISDDILLVCKSHESGEYVKQVSLRTSEALQMRRKEIEKHGYFVAKKSGRKISKLGNPVWESSLQKARDVSAKLRTSAILDNTEIMKVYDIIVLKRKEKETYAAIASFLESRGYKTIQGCLKWHKSTVKNLEVRVNKLIPLKGLNDLND